MPVIGHGDIASVLPERYDLLFFASGVSNSQEVRESEYKREVDLMLEQDSDAHVVYFSSLAALNGTTRYFRHKRQMEAVAKAHFATSAIVRIGNITWGDNPHTLINYLRAHPEAEIRDEWRYIVDEDEFLYWIDQIPRGRSSEINIPGRRLKVKDVYNEYIATHNE